MPDLSREQREILGLLMPLGEGGGYPTRFFGQRIWKALFSEAASALARHECERMERAGLVRRMDNLKPIVWVITDSGRTVLEREHGNG